LLFLSAFSGGQPWAVLAFLTSLVRSTADPKDALYHQQQAILRNTSQPAIVLWAMIKLSWFWKGTAKRARTRTFAFIFSSLVYIAAFAVAGIFSSKISSAQPEVLLLPAERCGLWQWPWLRNFDPAKGSFQDYQYQRSEFSSNVQRLTSKSHTEPNA
jgi:hypothetical protein